MLHKSKIGVYLDEKIAYLLERKNEEKVITIIEAEDDEDRSLPNKRNRKNHAFFKKVFELVRDFDRVFLYGPEGAKRELLNRIRAERGLQIEILNGNREDKVTDVQKYQFITEYFAN